MKIVMQWSPRRQNKSKIIKWIWWFYSILAPFQCERHIVILILYADNKCTLFKLYEFFCRFPTITPMACNLIRFFFLLIYTAPGIVDVVCARGFFYWIFRSWALKNAYKFINGCQSANVFCLLYPVERESVNSISGKSNEDPIWCTVTTFLIVILHFWHNTFVAVGFQCTHFQLKIHIFHFSLYLSFSIWQTWHVVYIFRSKKERTDTHTCSISVCK